MEVIGQGRPWAAIVGRKWADTVVLEVLSQFVSPSMVRQALEQTGRRSRRIRRLPAAAVVWLVVAMGIFRHLDMPSVWRQVIGTCQALWLAAALKRPPCSSAFSAARARLGARPMRWLFCHSAEPIARDQTRGAFYRGMRLKPSKRHEYRSARYLLKGAPSGSLVLWDNGFYGYSALAQALERCVEVLARVPDYPTFSRISTCSDGSFLAKLYPTTKDKRRDTRGILIRIIEYTFDDENRPGHGQRHRLYTTLLDVQTYPATELVVLYHERWEYELGNDEIKTHQLTKDMPTHLRSKTPAGVVQEFYGLLLAYNAVRQLMHAAAGSVDIDPRRLSFIHAVRVIRETIPIMRAAPTELLPYLYAALIQHIAAGRLPDRANRTNPRVVKTKMSNFAKKRPEDYNLPPPQKPFEQAVVILK